MKVVNRIETLKAVFEALGLDIAQPYTKVTIDLLGEFPKVTTERMIYKDEGYALAKTLAEFRLSQKE